MSRGIGDPEISVPTTFRGIRGRWDAAAHRVDIAADILCCGAQGPGGEPSLPAVGSHLSEPGAALARHPAFARRLAAA
jgi:hypothetical protein